MECSPFQIAPSLRHACRSEKNLLRPKDKHIADGEYAAKKGGTD
jgi:hypothetical protein